MKPQDGWNLEGVQIRMPVNRIVNLIISGLALCVMFGACGRSSTVEGNLSGCRQEIRGVMGVTVPETSKLSCAAINELISGLPSEPQGYSIMGDSPRLLWNCRFYGAEAQRVLLRCRHHKLRFSIVKGAG